LVNIGLCKLAGILPLLGNKRGDGERIDGVGKGGRKEREGNKRMGEEGKEGGRRRGEEEGDEWEEDEGRRSRRG